MKCFVLLALSAKSHVLRLLSLLICMDVDCLHVVSQVKDLKQWASVFSATFGFRNHCIKSGYEKSRVTSIGHDAWCA